jgi:hypothetical protein
MGVAPEAMVKKNSIDSKILAACLVFPHYDLHKQKMSSLSFLSFIGCATSAPDGSSPQGYGRVLVVNHRLNNFL